MSQPIFSQLFCNILFLVIGFYYASTANADLWSYEDSQGIIHFTNITPQGKNRHRWNAIYKSGPGKAKITSMALPSTTGGTATSSYAGCRHSDSDVVPATDRSLARYTRYNAYIAEAAAIYLLPQNLIRAVIQAESDYNPQVVSCAGAKGLMQIMPDEEISQHMTNVFDPRDNILAGSRLLRLHANRFQGDMVLAVAAHHAGEGAVQKYHGIPPYETTQMYVRAVLKFFQRAQEKHP